METSHPHTVVLGGKAGRLTTSETAHLAALRLEELRSLRGGLVDACDKALRDMAVGVNPWTVEEELRRRLNVAGSKDEQGVAA